MTDRPAEGGKKSKRLVRSKSGPYSDSSGEWKTDPENLPHSVYFYYVHSDKSVRAYFWANPPGHPIPLGVEPGTELNKLIFALTENAQKSQPDNPRPVGWKFSDVPWVKKSHIVIVLEDDEFVDWVVDIKRKKGNDVYENHCFFDGGAGELSDGQGNTVQALWVVNYMKNLSGEDIPKGKSHDFKWKFRTKKGRPPIIEDGNGTNMGPPVPPP